MARPRDIPVRRYCSRGSPPPGIGWVSPRLMSLLLRRSGEPRFCRYLPDTLRSYWTCRHQAWGSTLQGYPVIADSTISTCPQTISEIEEALGGMKSGKAVRVCGIPVELLKAGDGAVLRGLAAVFNKTWKYLRDPFRLEKGTHFPNLPG